MNITVCITVWTYYNMKGVHKYPGSWNPSEILKKLSISSGDTYERMHAVEINGKYLV